MKLARVIQLPLLLALVLAATACSGPPKTWYVLIDVSGSYAEQVPEAVKAVRFLLTRAQPGDRITIARIESASFSNESIIAQVRLPERPSRANEAKQAIAKELERFQKTMNPSRKTDIRGGIANAARQLQDAPGPAHLVIFSDLAEDIDETLERGDLPSLKGIEVLAVNVTPTRSDNRDPAAFRERLGRWEERFRAAGAASWEVLETPELADAVYNE